MIGVIHGNPPFIYNLLVYLDKLPFPGGLVNSVKTIERGLLRLHILSCKFLLQGLQELSL